MKDCYFSKYEPIFGSWHITGELGSGAEGHLYRISREDALGHVFYSALKAVTIPPGGNAELESLIAGGMPREDALRYYDDVLDNTVQEFELLEKLKGNSNIVSYEDHDIFRREEGFGWDILIRMEELTPLTDYSAYHQIDEAEVIRMGKGLCRGLELCSRYGIVHRDIKPENIFISAAGNYKLGDFGIARIIEETSTSLSRKGTYSYMAPEVYWGKEYDQTVDLYSLGMVMYRYMNDGRVPFMPMYPQPTGYQDGESAFVKRVSGSEIPAPRNGSDGLKSIILKACAYDKQDRYSSAGEMLRDLEALERGEEIRSDGARPHDESSSDRKPGLKGRLIAAAIAVMLAAGGIIYASIPKEVEDIETAGLQDGMEIYIDEELVPEYTVKPDWFKDEPVEFASDNTDVITVDEAGHIHAISPGEASVSMKAKEYEEAIRLKVVPKVSAIEEIDSEISLTTGNTLELSPVLKPEKFASEPITYGSSDDGVATVSADGVLTAVSAGKTVLTISAGGTSITSEVTVSDPVVYRKQSSGSSRKSSKSKSGSSSGKASKGYFSSGDDESF